jgi:hypothetical protein
MKITLSAFIFSICCCIANTSLAQLLGTDATGNSPLVMPGVAASADIQHTNFTASFTGMQNNKYYKSNGLLGISLSGGERAGFSSLLQNGATSGYATVRATAGFCTNSDYEGKYQPRDEYEKDLLDEKKELTNYINSIKNDTVLISTYLSGISPQYAVHLEILKKIYRAVGPDANQLQYLWLKTAKAIADSIGDQNFYNEVSGAVTMVKSMVYYQENFNDAKNKLESINTQLLNIDKPKLPFNRDILYLTLGGTALQLNKINTNPQGIINNIGKQNITSGFVAIGGSHSIADNVFIGYQVNYTTYDNFERLNMSTYTEDSLNKGISKNGSLQKKFNGYTDTLQQKNGFGLAFQLSFLQPIGKTGGYALFTPLYCNVSVRSSVGASVAVVTKSGFTAGLNVQYDNIADDVLTNKKNDTAYNNFSFGFRVGCLLANFHN